MKDTESLARELEKIYNELPKPLETRYEYPFERLALHVQTIILEAQEAQKKKDAELVRKFIQDNFVIEGEVDPSSFCARVEKLAQQIEAKE